jgi:outer membrane lipoprotein SlyB
MNSLKTGRLVIVALLVGGLAGGCVSSPSGSAYTRSEARTAQNVQLGTVVSVRDVQIEGTKSNIGTGIGAVAGGLGGSYLGKSPRGTALGALGGAVAGGLLGSAAEEGLTKRAGLQITVRLDNGQVTAITQGADEPFAQGERVQIITSPDGTTRVSH